MESIMKIIKQSKVVSLTLLSLASSSAFAGDPLPVMVSEPSTLALIAGGALAVIYLAKKFK